MHGWDGPVIVVSPRVAAWLVVHTDLAPHRIAERGNDPEVDAVLLAITRVGNAWRTSATSAPSGSQKAPEPEVAPLSKVMSSSEAAEVLGVTDRAVRLACEAGRLPATRTARRWQITRTDLDTYRRDRAA